MASFWAKPAQVVWARHQPLLSFLSSLVLESHPALPGSPRVLCVYRVRAGQRCLPITAGEVHIRPLE